jgi:hypothetical protein
MSRETFAAPLPPGPRGRIAVGMARGDAAARAGLPPTACPYDAGTLPLSRAAWTAGYSRARRRIDPDRTPSAIAEASDPDAPWPNPNEERQP